MHARQGTTSYPEQICLIRFTWGAQWRIWGRGAVLTVFTSCLSIPAFPTTSPGPPRAWGLDWGEAGADRSWKGLGGAEKQKSRQGGKGRWRRLEPRPARR